MSNFLDSNYQDLNGLTNISSDEIRTNVLYVNGLLIDPNSTNLNNINCQTLTCQGDLSSNTIYAVTSIQNIPVSKYAYLLNVSSDIQSQFTNITNNYVLSSFLTSNYRNNTYLTTNLPTLSAANTYTGNNTFPEGTFTYIHALNCRSLYNMTYVDLRQCSASQFRTTGELISISAIVGLTSALNLKANISQLSDYVLTTALTTALSDYVLTTALNTKLSDYVLTTALNTKLSDYVLTTTLSNYVLTTALNTKLSDYVLTTTLSNYVLTTALNTTLSNYVLTTALNTALSNYVLTTALNTKLSDYVLTTALNTKLSDYVLTTALTTTLNNYVLTTALNTTLSNYVLTSFLTSNYRNNAYLTANIPTLTGNNTYGGNNTFPDGTFTFIHALECKNLYNMVYVDFRFCGSGNFLINNNMIAKSVIIGLTSDLSTINTNISNLTTQTNTNTAVIATNTAAITALGVLTTTHTGQIAGNTAAIGVLQGEMFTAQSNITTLQAKTSLQSVVGAYLQLTGGLKIMSGLNYNAIINTDGSATFYGKMIIDDELQVNSGITCAGIQCGSANITSGDFTVSAAGQSIINNNLTLNNSVVISTTGSTVIRNPTTHFNSLNINDGSMNTITLSANGSMIVENTLDVNNKITCVEIESGSVTTTAIETETLDVTNGNFTVANVGQSIFNNAVFLNNDVTISAAIGTQTFINNQLNINGGIVTSDNYNSQFSHPVILNDNLTISAASVVTVNSPATINNNLTITNGFLSISGNGTNVINNPCTFNGDIQFNNPVSLLESLYIEGIDGVLTPKVKTRNIDFVGSSGVQSLSIGSSYNGISSISIGNSLSVITLNGITAFNGPSFNLSSFINQVL